jgi:endoglucanase
MSRLRFQIALPLTLVTLLVAGAVLAHATPTPHAAQSVDPRGLGASDPNPLADLPLYVDHDSPSWHQWQFFSHSGKTKDANLIWKIAREPKAIWVGRFTRPNFYVKVNRIFDTARSQGQVPLLTVLRAQSTGCSPTYQGGGPAEDAATSAWYDDLARAIGSKRAVVAFEPDSLGTIDCHAKSRRDDRIRLLRHGVMALANLPNVTLYIEAGASDWESAKRTAKLLRLVGVAKARGFMLNATHYDWTANNIKHGLDISRRIGGKHFVINTAENGRGGIHYRLGNGRRITVWCNPGLRGLGPAPTTDTANRKVDAYLWINRPGYAQSCQHRPIAWYVPRALTYARHATDWIRPPKGTRFGYRKRYPAGVFGIP